MTDAGTFQEPLLVTGVGVYSKKPLRGTTIIEHFFHAVLKSPIVNQR